MKTKSTRLSNVELVLLQLIHGASELSGYEINKLIEQRGYREWADIGETSIYSGLNKLHMKELVGFYINSDKQGRGPLPKKYKLSGKGEDMLKEETLKALSSTRERDKRFDIALAGIPFVETGEALRALNERKKYLANECARIAKIYSAQNGSTIPYHVQLLFRHPSILIEAELIFMDEIINTLIEQGNHHDNRQF
jgi:DNA-binding PadR family transcriptional regulator